jgi:formylglycine-generating enzyme required for sulfatase activity
MIAANLAFSLVVLGCGQIPDTREETGTQTGSGGSRGEGGAALAPFLCKSSAQPGDMVSVPAGDFPMGCNDQVDTGCDPNEKPLHTVTLGAFAIDRTEVTQGQYTSCVQAGTCSAPSCDWNCAATESPAACIDWPQAKAFCAWAAGKRLPTEAEWEKTARGSDGRKYPWGNEDADCTRVNMAGCGDRAQDVGSHASGASPYGALDMAGNVVEMVADWYDATFYQSSPVTDPRGPATGTRYSGRGGGYKSEAVWQRVSARDWYDPSDISKTLGFRCAR